MEVIVTQGGAPTGDELAAITAALAALAAGRTPRDPVPAWTRAALHEQAGAPLVTAPGELQVPGVGWGDVDLMAAGRPGG